MGDLVRQTAGLLGWDRLYPGYLRNLHRNCSQSDSSLFDQDLDQFMNTLDNFEPFDDLKDWSNNVDLFMDAMANPPEHANALWELVMRT